jgi:hypothetical protein
MWYLYNFTINFIFRMNSKWADFCNLLKLSRFKCASQPLTVNVIPSRKRPLAVKVHPLSWSQRQFNSVQWAYGDLTTSSDKLHSRLYGCAITLNGLLREAYPKTSLYCNGNCSSLTDQSSCMWSSLLAPVPNMSQSMPQTHQ